MFRVSSKWMAYQSDLIKEGKSIDAISVSTEATQWLIASLSRHGTPYKVHSLGAGVKRITTDTDTCPCCKRVL